MVVQAGLRGMLLHLAERTAGLARGRTQDGPEVSPEEQQALQQVARVQTHGHVDHVAHHHAAQDAVCEGDVEEHAVGGHGHLVVRPVDALAAAEHHHPDLMDHRKKKKKMKGRWSVASAEFKSSFTYTHIDSMHVYTIHTYI